MRQTIYKSVHDSITLKAQLIGWAAQFREAVVLDSNAYEQQYTTFDFVVAVDAFTLVQTDWHNAFEDLHQYREQTRDWLFGYLSYDLKNDTEDLQSNNFDGLHFADLFFFQPKKIISMKGNTLVFEYLSLCADEIEEDFESIVKWEVQQQETSNEVVIKQRISREAYQEKASFFLEHIHRGDIYEANFCMEFYAEHTKVDPVSLYHKLNTISTPPFACFLKNNHHFLVSASPERYLRKQGNTVISQPIKGTAPRSFDTETDLELKTALAKNPKERSENIMIVDLVRNDLSRTASKGSVQVAELCGSYAFRQVHQLISTIVSEVDSSVSPVEIIKTTFPMGSMTGAPKISAMQLIEKYEKTQRGLYSGAVGYFTPTGDFDFNVVIRSILYNRSNQYLSFSVGSALTAQANPEQEYEECLLKAKAMFDVLQSK